MKNAILTIIALLGAAGSASGQVACSAITPGFNVFTGGALNGFIPFPQSTGWHTDITNSAVDPRSPAWIEDIRKTADRRLRSLYNPATTDSLGTTWEGFPYHVVGSNQPRVEVRIDPVNGYPADSDPGPMPIPFYPRVQFTFGPGTQVNYNNVADKHIIVLDKDNCLLYELFGVTYTENKIVAGAAAVFDMQGGDHQRPYGLTSGSVSGLPLFPGLPRGDELAAGVINHPIAVTAFYYANSGNFFPDKSYTDMASHHQYGSGDWNPSTMPLGAKLRLRSTFDVTPFPPQAQVILNAMKTYGAILTDGGGTIDIYGATSNNWDAPSTISLYTSFGVTSSDFDVIQTGPIYCDPLYSCGLQAPTGAPPTISSFTASTTQTAVAGQPVTLRWNVSNVPTRIRFVTPEVGPVVTDSVIVKPLRTTTYTMMVENAFGRASATATVIVGNQIYVGVSPGLVPNAVSMNLTLTTSTGDVMSVPCAVSPCMISVPPGAIGQSLQVQYLSAGGTVLATSGNMTINVR